MLGVWSLALGRAGPYPSSLLSSLLSSACWFGGGAVGRSSRGAGGGAGPATLRGVAPRVSGSSCAECSAGPIFLRFSGSSGLTARFAPEVVVACPSASSSCCLFLLASKCGGRSGVMSDIVMVRCTVFWRGWRLWSSACVHVKVELSSAEASPPALLDHLRARDYHCKTIASHDIGKAVY